MNTPTLAATLLATLGLALPASANLIANGDFEAGNSGFSTDYQLGGNLYDEGVAAITGQVNALHSLLQGTPQSGDAFLAVNGAPSADQTVWRQSVAVSAGSTYVFSMWVASLFPDALATLVVSINGAVIGEVTAPTMPGYPQPGPWQRFEASWNAGEALTAQIRIVDTNTIRFGNDFGLDNLSLLAAPSGPGGQAVVAAPAAAALFGMGLLALASLSSRRAAPGAVPAHRVLL
jgi:hypothetical protein